MAGGHLAIGHKPGRRLRSWLEAQGCTLVVNLLSHSESRASPGPRRIRLPLASADPPADVRDDEIEAVFHRIAEALGASGRVYLHCSAGLHRTGMIAYALLRYLGHSPDEAMAELRELRALAADEVGEHRIAWGEAWVARRGSGQHR